MFDVQAQKPFRLNVTELSPDDQHDQSKPIDTKVFGILGPIFFQYKKWSVYFWNPITSLNFGSSPKSLPSPILASPGKLNQIQTAPLEALNCSKFKL